MVAEFDDKDAAGLQMRRRLGNEVGIKFVTFFAAEKRDFRLVITHFSRQGAGFTAADVGRVGSN